MSAYSFKLPDIGEGIAEAEIVAWHVAVGDRIEEDAPLADMMTDKATVEISAPVTGRVLKIGGQVGDQVAIGSVLAVLEIERGKETAELSASSEQEVVEVAAEQPSTDAGGGQTAMPTAPAETAIALPTLLPNARSSVAGGGGTSAARRASASPAVRRRAADLGVDLKDVDCATGDRVRHSDLDAFLSYNASYRPAAARRSDEQHKVIGLRRRIAENMAASKRHIPHFTYVEEINVTKLEAMREDLNLHRGERPKLTLLPLLIVGICKALATFPMINARYDDETGIVTRSGAVHLGIATQTDSGLMVPVLRDAQDRNIWQLASDIRRLADAARSGKASSAELSGSTLTITSLGPLGGIATTPVINRPEVAIIGPNRIVERPVLRNGEVEVAKLMNLSVSCDHRVVDGWDAASFVQRLRNLLETPAILFIG